MDQEEPSTEPDPFRAMQAAKVRIDSITKATWAVIFGLGFATGQWVPRTVWFVGLALLLVLVVVLAVKVARAIIAESVITSATLRRVKFIEPSEKPPSETGGVTKGATA